MDRRGPSAKVRVYVLYARGRQASRDWKAEKGQGAIKVQVGCGRGV